MLLLSSRNNRIATASQFKAQSDAAVRVSMPGVQVG